MARILRIGRSLKPSLAGASFCNARLIGTVLFAQKTSR
jgi:hypothetical protein